MPDGCWHEWCRTPESDRIYAVVVCAKCDARGVLLAVDAARFPERSETEA
jgi:hypothetical protein